MCKLLPALVIGTLVAFPSHVLAKESRLVKRIDDHLTALADYGFYGVVRIERGERVLLSKGYGWADRQAKTKNTPRTAFAIGSLSKQFTAAAVLKLVDEGAIKLDDRLPQFFADVPEDKQAISLHQILTHTAGLPEYHDEDGDFEVLTRQEAVRRILAADLEFPPGSEFQYSNSGYTMLAVVVEIASGTTFEAFLRNALFDPASMDSTGFLTEPRWAATRLAHAYIDTSDNGAPNSWANGPDVWALKGAGGIVSTIEDLGAWMRALTGGAILSEDSLEAMLTGHVNAGSTGDYGYGWYITDDAQSGKGFSHGGGNDLGVATKATRSETRDTTVILAVNREIDGVWIGMLAGAVEDDIWRLLAGDAVQTPPATSGIPAHKPRSMLGSYLLPDGGRIVVTSGPDGCRLTPEGDSAIALLTLREPARVALAKARTADTLRIFRDWLDGRIVRFGRDTYAKPPSITFRRAAGKTWVGYHSGVGVTAPVSLSFGPDGEAQALTISTASETLTAIRTSVGEAPYSYSRDGVSSTPEPFAGGTVKSNDGFAISRDGTTLWVSRGIPQRNRQGKHRVRIFNREFDGSGWTATRPVSFASEFDDYQPSLSSDGRRMFFNSTRPAPGGSEETDLNSWYVDRGRSGWSKARFLEAANSSSNDGYAVVTRDGTLYFTSNRPGGRGAHDIYRAAFEGGRYAAPQNVSPLNSELSETTMYVDPFDRFIVLSRYDPARSDPLDLYISHRVADAWSEPQPLSQLNSDGMDLGPIITPDGKYFLYVGQGGVLQQIDAESVLTDLEAH